jgi:hypothetical protein
MVPYRSSRPQAADAADCAEIECFFQRLFPDAEDGYLVLSRPDPDPTHVHAKGKRWLHSAWLDLAQTSLKRAAQVAATLSQHERSRSAPAMELAHAIAVLINSLRQEVRPCPR